jgi:hypothetical protein
MEAKEMRKIRIDAITKLGGIAAALALLIAASSSTANAQCFGSFEKLTAAAALARENTRSTLPGFDAKLAASKSVPDSASDNAVRPSIVGFWHVHYLFPDMDQEAFQTFETGGTEIHNPNTPTDGVCLGAWTDGPGNVVKLTHRVWLYDNGNFVGVGHLNATIRLRNRGYSQSGTFTLQIFDLNGNAITPPIPGTLSGERIVPN